MADALETAEIKLIRKMGIFPGYAAGQVLVHLRSQRRQRETSYAEMERSPLFRAQLLIARTFLKALLDISNRPIPEPEVTPTSLDLADVVETVSTRRITASLLAQLTREELDLLGVPECFAQDPDLKIDL